MVTVEQYVLRVRVMRSTADLDRFKDLVAASLARAAV
jgi:hypothetical protein